MLDIQNNSESDVQYFTILPDDASLSSVRSGETKACYVQKRRHIGLAFELLVDICDVCINQSAVKAFASIAEQQFLHSSGSSPNSPEQSTSREAADHDSVQSSTEVGRSIRPQAHMRVGELALHASYLAATKGRTLLRVCAGRYIFQPSSNAFLNTERDMAVSPMNLPKEIVTELHFAPRPETGILLQVRAGKVGALGKERSAIFKKEQKGKVFVSETGVTGDEHVYFKHGGTERALHQYAPQHYADWRKEAPPKPELFDFGGFGENLVATNMSEENVCVGDLYRIGDQVIVQVSEPRSPCSKLNVRFEWPRALKRIQRLGRVGWNFRVLSVGYIQAGDEIALLQRPHPQWSVMNVKRVIQGKSVPMPLIQELAYLEPLTDTIRGYAQDRLYSTPKKYVLATSETITARVRQLTFRLAEPTSLRHPAFKDFAFAQIEFGRNPKFARCYSIVSGDLNTFSLGIALDDHSRGGSAYLHQILNSGDEIVMSPGGNAKATEDETKCMDEDCVAVRVVIIGGIGVTAFIPIIEKWEAEDVPYEVHYAVRSMEDAAYLSRLPEEKTKVYAKSQGKRLNIEEVIPPRRAGQDHNRKIYCCGPNSLMDACEQRAKFLGYPEHLMHFESFVGDAGGAQGPPFEVHVNDMESGRSEDMVVTANKTLLQTLVDAGFDMTFFCKRGGCGACKVTVCKGDVEYKSSGLKAGEKPNSLLSCVDRGIGRIEIELD
nr:protein yiim [Quercus suber]